MHSDTYADRWKSFVAARGYDQAAARDPFENWDRSSAPESRAESALEYALFLLYSDYGSEPARVLLRQCVEICARVAREDKLESELCLRSFPLNRGHLNRALAYARALLGEDQSLGQLEGAAKDFVDFCRRLGRVWSDQTQAYYLGAARMYLLVGKTEHAIKMLDHKWGFSAHQEEFEVLHGIAMRSAKPSKKAQEKLLNQLDIFFDRIRDPDFRQRVFLELRILRLEIGALRQKTFSDNRGSINWKDVILSISS